jgi:hypothetical protein
MLGYVRRVYHFRRLATDLQWRMLDCCVSSREQVAILRRLGERPPQISCRGKHSAWCLFTIFHVSRIQHISM